MLSIRLLLHPLCLNAFYLISQKRLPFYFSLELHFTFSMHSRRAWESWLLIPSAAFPFLVVIPPTSFHRGLEVSYDKGGGGERESHKTLAPASAGLWKKRV